MATKVKFEIQIELKSNRWEAIGGQSGYYYINEDNRFDTNTYKIEDARKMLKKLERLIQKGQGFTPNLRIVQIEVVTTYTVVS